MENATERTAKSTQEQAVASGIYYLNQARLDTLIENLNKQDTNLEQAMIELAELKKFLGNPEHILGSNITKHGEIAEHMQVNLSNARHAIKGLNKEYTFEGVGRTAPEDYLKNGQQIQSKFYNGLKQTFFNSHGIKDHLKMYPDFVKNGGAYHIPKDQFEELMQLWENYKSTPSLLSKAEYSLAKKIDEFLDTNNLELGKDITPAIPNYKDVQQNTAGNMVVKEEREIKKEDLRQRKKAYDASKPSLKEGCKATAVSAALEGGVTFCMSVAQKRKEKNFSEFTSDDWKEIGLKTGKGTIKGGIRGSSVYALTNFTATPANVASAYVTAIFGFSSQVRELERGNISKEDFIINCETVCLDVTVSAISSFAGQLVIQIPYLGAIIGNIVGEFVYDLCKKVGTKRSRQIIQKYHAEIMQLNQQLNTQLLEVIMQIQKAMKQFGDLEKLAFDNDVNIAFNGSINLAIEIGVGQSQILRTQNQIDDYFML